MNGSASSLHTVSVVTRGGKHSRFLFGIAGISTCLLLAAAEMRAQTQTTPTGPLANTGYTVVVSQDQDNIGCFWNITVEKNASALAPYPRGLKITVGTADVYVCNEQLLPQPPWNPTRSQGPNISTQGTGYQWVQYVDASNSVPDNISFKIYYHNRSQAATIDLTIDLLQQNLAALWTKQFQLPHYRPYPHIAPKKNPICPGASTILSITQPPYSPISPEKTVQPSANQNPVIPPLPFELNVGDVVSWYKYVVAGAPPAATIYDAPGWQEMVGNGGLQLQTGIIMETTWFAAVVRRGSCCERVSLPIKIDVCPGYVLDPASMDVCAVMPPAPTPIHIDAIGGTSGCPVTTVQWAVSSNGGAIWTNLPANQGQTAISFIPQPVTPCPRITYLVKAEISSACSPIPQTAVGTITYWQNSTVPVLTANPPPPLCNGSATTLTLGPGCGEDIVLKVSVPLSPICDPIVWSIPSPVTGNGNGTAYTTPPLTGPRRYVATRKNGPCPALSSLELEVDVKPATQTLVSPSGPAYLCSAAPLTLTAQCPFYEGGGGTCVQPHTHAWLKNGLPMNVSGASLSVTEVGNYQAQTALSSGSCHPAISDAVAVCKPFLRLTDQSGTDIQNKERTCICENEQIQVTAHLFNGCAPPSGPNGACQSSNYTWTSDPVGSYLWNNSPTFVGQTVTINEAGIPGVGSQKFKVSAVCDDNCTVEYTFIVKRCSN